MFEKYTEKARRTIFFARYEASQFGSRHIEVSHLMLGLVRECGPTFWQISGKDAVALRQAIESLCTRFPEQIPTTVDLPLSIACRRVLTYAAEEAARLSHPHIGPEHLLLGVLLENGREAKVLEGFGMGLEVAREKFRGSGGEAPAGRVSGTLRGSIIPGGSRESLERLLADVPDDRLAAAARLLAGLSSEYFVVAGMSTDGPFSYSFGNRPPAAPAPGAVPRP